jgi:hypothetical protein
MQKLQKYISVIAVVVSVTSIIISYTTSRKARITGVQPVLVFLFNRNTGYSLQNIGNGPALNIVYTVKDSRKGWTMPTRIPPLARDGVFLRIPPSPSPAAAFGCTYSDIKGRTYTTVLENEQIRISDRSPFPEWKAEDFAPHWKR